MQVSVDPDGRVARHGGRPLALSPQEVAVLSAFADVGDRVVGRRELRRRAGLAASDPRRCDSLLVALRRELGPGAIVTVRGRGWRCLARVVTLSDLTA